MNKILDGVQRRGTQNSVALEECEQDDFIFSLVSFLWFLKDIFIMGKIQIRKQYLSCLLSFTVVLHVFLIITNLFVCGTIHFPGVNLSFLTSTYFPVSCMMMNSDVG